MSFATLLPLGMLQLYHSVSSGYFEARSLEFLTTETAAALEWMRLPGDALFIVGILPLLYVGWISVRHMAAPVAATKPSDRLFTEVSEEMGARP